MEKYGKSYNFGKKIWEIWVTWLTGWKNTVMCFSIWDGAGPEQFRKTRGIQERSVQDAPECSQAAKALSAATTLYRLPRRNAAFITADGWNYNLPSCLSLWEAKLKVRQGGWKAVQELSPGLWTCLHFQHIWARRIILVPDFTCIDTFCMAAIWSFSDCVRRCVEFSLYWRCRAGAGPAWRAMRQSAGAWLCLQSGGTDGRDPLPSEVVERNLQALRKQGLRILTEGSRMRKGVVNLILISEEWKGWQDGHNPFWRGILNILRKLWICQIQQKAFK